MCRASLCIVDDGIDGTAIGRRDQFEAGRTQAGPADIFSQVTDQVTINFGCRKCIQRLKPIDRPFFRLFRRRFARLNQHGNWIS
jgi:hypothetical protein